MEDHEHTRAVLSRLLKRDGHKVDAVATCAEALEAGSEKPYEMLISDLGLPDGSGLTVMRELRLHHPEMAAIALSGYGADEDIRKSISAGFHAHLTKPISIDELRRHIEAAHHFGSKAA